MSNALIYVTRKSADGWTGTYAMPVFIANTVFVLCLLNIIGWGIYGLYVLGDKVI